MSECTENCPLTVRVEALEEANKQHGKTHREMFGRLGKLETENAVQNERYTAIDKKLDDLKAMVADLTAKPGKRWDGLIKDLISAVVGGLVVYALFRLGLSA